MEQPTPPASNMSSEPASHAQVDHGGSADQWAAATNHHTINGIGSPGFDEAQLASLRGNNNEAFNSNNAISANQDGSSNDNASLNAQPPTNSSGQANLNNNDNSTNGDTHMNDNSTNQDGVNGHEGGGGAGPSSNNPPADAPNDGGPPDGGARGGQPAPDPNLIDLKVKDQAGNETHFRVKNTTRLQKIFSAYASKEGKDLHTLRFLFDGDRLDASGTIESSEIESGDTIEVMLEQIGGALDMTISNTAIHFTEAAHEVQKAADLLSKHGPRILGHAEVATLDDNSSESCFKEAITDVFDVQELDSYISADRDADGSILVSYRVKDGVDVLDEYSVNLVIKDGQVCIDLSNR